MPFYQDSNESNEPTNFDWLSGLFDWFSGIADGAVLKILFIIITLRTIVDLLQAFNYLPPRILKFLLKGEKARFNVYLEEFGLGPVKERIRSAVQLLDSTLPVADISNSELKDRLNAILFDYIEVSDFIIGDVSKIKITNYVNVRKAFCTLHTEVIAKIMAYFINNEMEKGKFVYDCIVSRKGALDLLGFRVASLLKTKFLLYNDFPAVWEDQVQEDGSAFDFEYSQEGVNKAIIVDDSCVSGNSIIKMAESLRNNAIEVTDVFVLFTRGEANPKDSFSTYNLRLHSIAKYTDRMLKKARKKRRGNN